MQCGIRGGLKFLPHCGAGITVNMSLMPRSGLTEGLIATKNDRRRSVVMKLSPSVVPAVPRAGHLASMRHCDVSLAPVGHTTQAFPVSGSPPRWFPALNCSAASSVTLDGVTVGGLVTERDDWRCLAWEVWDAAVIRAQALRRWWRWWRRRRPAVAVQVGSRWAGGGAGGGGGGVGGGGGGGDRGIGVPCGTGLCRAWCSVGAPSIA